MGRAAVLDSQRLLTIALTSLGILLAAPVLQVSGHPTFSSIGRMWPKAAVVKDMMKYLSVILPRQEGGYLLFVFQKGELVLPSSAVQQGEQTGAMDHRAFRDFSLPLTSSIWWSSIFCNAMIILSDQAPFWNIKQIMEKAKALNDVQSKDGDLTGLYFLSFNVKTNVPLCSVKTMPVHPYF